MEEAVSGVPEREAPQVIPDPADTPEPEAEAPNPPDVGEAISQLNSRFDSIESRLPEPEADEGDLMSRLIGEPEDGYGDEPAAEESPEGEGGDDAEFMGELRRMFAEEAQKAILPYAQHQEAQAREQGIHALAEQYPALQKPEVAEAIGNQLQALGLQPEGFPPDPRHVELALKAYVADSAESAGSSAEAETAAKATLETGVGPNAPEPEIDPVQKAYNDAILGNRPTDLFSQ